MGNTFEGKAVDHTRIAVIVRRVSLGLASYDSYSRNHKVLSRI